MRRAEKPLAKSPNDNGFASDLLLVLGQALQMVVQSRLVALVLFLLEVCSQPAPTSSHAPRRRKCAKSQSTDTHSTGCSKTYHCGRTEGKGTGLNLAQGHVIVVHGQRGHERHHLRHASQHLPLVGAGRHLLQQRGAVGLRLGKLDVSSKG